MEDTSRENAREKLAQAFQDNRERLLRLAERHLNPVLRRRVSPEDVVQEAAGEACRWGGSFLENDDLLLTQVEALIKNMQEYYEALKDRDEERLRFLLREGREIKEALEE